MIYGRSISERCRPRQASFPDTDKDMAGAHSDLPHRRAALAQNAHQLHRDPIPAAGGDGSSYKAILVETVMEIAEGDSPGAGATWVQEG